MRAPSPFAASLAFAALLAAPGTAQVLTGADVLARDGRAVLGREHEPGWNLGLITNHTGVTRDGRRTVDVLVATEGVKLTRLFSPEHGWQGAVDEKVGDTVDDATGLKVHSLYGETRRPSAEMLDGLDALVFDIQDIGCRFYTYVATMRNCMEAAAEHGVAFVVLDRPNPIGGVAVEGPLMAAERRDFVGAHTIPLRHGMTAGELARMMAGEDGIGVELVVVPCEGWRRAELYDATGLYWVDPSPNMRRLSQALLYPGIGIVEGTNVSVGRGTDTPFEILGAPWCDGRLLATTLNAAKLPGVTFVPVHFTPASSKHEGARCSGVQILLTDWRTFEPVRTGVHVACALRQLFPDDWQPKKLDWLLKHPASHAAIVAGAPADEIVAAWQKDLKTFALRRRPFLIYE
ncbi:MAG: DUF1343 domain-containing protein [Planctomycetes bacterium]|nr:DUF1343 domain-containing protein [Planctomycetota bacterium]